jgi:CxxC-x17-CxxC domain-containing protein
MRAARNAELIGLYQRSDALGFAEPALASERRPAKGGGRSPGRVQEFRQRYNTVCAACGSETQVPFVPRGDRPVYCRDCFNARKGR